MKLSLSFVVFKQICCKNVIASSTCRTKVPLHPVPSCAPIFAGLLGLIGCLWIHMMNCPLSSQSADGYFIAGWAHVRCRLSKTGLQGQVRQDIHLAAHSAPVGPLVMSGTPILNVRVLVTRLSFAELFDDAHRAMQTLVWHKDQKALSALILAICRPTRHSSSYAIAG